MSPADAAPAPLAGWLSPPAPVRASIVGQRVRLEPLTVDHAAELHAANSEDGAGGLWRWLPYGPFARAADYAAWVGSVTRDADPLFFAIRAGGRAVGVAAYLRIAPAAGSIEVGHIAFAPALQRSAAATEAMYLLMRWAFEAGYRRYEWKCDALNGPSRRAAQRLGLSFEGVFRQATVVKGRNRDTAWYAAIDAEWPRLGAAFRTWLAPENFDAGGRQRVALSVLTAPILVATG